MLDGWWVEGFDGENGWAIGDDSGGRESGDRDDEGIPARWVGVMKRAIRTIAPRFSTRLLLTEYVVRLYAPAAAAR